ncbi:MAG: hypothetical protein NWP83_08650, partial [Spirosomaceae bacterium]|nr:hypothetical protein [Spirosomataceae bacterium]
MKKLSILLLLALLPAIGYSQNGKFDVRLSYGEYTCSPEKITVLVEVKSSSSGTSFAMGDATMRFDYKLSEVVNPVLKTQHNFSSAATPRDFNYQPLTISTAEAGDDGILTLNITYAGLVDGAKNVSTDWVSVATLEFDLRSANKCVELKWHDNTRTPITGMSEIITPGSQPVAQAITGTQFLDMSYCVTDYLPTATISASPTSITQGVSSTLSVTLTAGTGNWSATLSDGNTVSNSSNSVATFSVSPTTTTTYSITSLSDACGTNAYPS